MCRIARPLLLGNLWVHEKPGGLDRYLAELGNALSRADLIPTTVVLGPSTVTPGVVTPARHDQPLITRLWAFRRAVTDAVSGGVDVVDSHFALNTIVPLVTGGLKGLPLVVHFQGPWAEESAVSRRSQRGALRLKRTIERTVYRRADGMVTLSAAFKRVAVERYGVSPWKVSVHPPGVDLERFRPPSGREERDEIRNRLGIAPETFLAVCARRLDERMGIGGLLNVWAGLPPGHLLVVAGDGPLRDQLESRLIDLGISDNVRLAGRVDDDELVALYQAADVSVVPSVALEGYGLVVLESLACGTPPLVSDVGGLPEAVASLDPSLIVAVDKPDAWAARILAASSGAAPLPDTVRCRSYASAFTWDKVASHSLDCYQRATRRPRSRRLRVIYLDHCAELSGGELALLRTLSYLEQVEAHVILAQDGPLAAKLARAGISTEVRPMPEAARSLSRRRLSAGGMAVRATWATSAHAISLARRLRTLRPDLVHTNSLKSALYGGLAAHLAGIPVVWHVRDRIASDYMPGLAVRLVRALSRRLPEAILIDSRAVLHTLGPLPVATVAAVVPSPIEPGLLDVQSIRNGGPLRVGMVGRLAPWKGQHVFLEAFARAFAGGEEEAVVVGSAFFSEEEIAYESSLRDMVLRLGLEHRVRFAGFVEDVASEMVKMDIVVHASVVPEPFGQVVVEAMALGLPVIASGAGGPAEVVSDGVDGLLHPPGDVEALTAALKRLASDPGLRRRLGTAGRERARQFTPSVVAPQIMAVYERLLGPRWPNDVPKPRQQP